MLKVRERWVDSGGGGAAAHGGGAPEKVSTQRPTQRFINPRNPQKTLHHFTRITAIFLFPIGYIYPQAFSKNHGGLDSSVIKRRQQQLGRMADFLPSVTFSVFDL